MHENYKPQNYKPTNTDPPCSDSKALAFLPCIMNHSLMKAANARSPYVLQAQCIKLTRRLSKSRNQYSILGGLIE